MALTLKQENFCQFYVASRDPSGSYRAAYDCAPTATDAGIRGAANELLRNPTIAARVKELIATATVNQIAKPLAEIIDVIDQMASVDYDELSSEGVGSCRHCWGVGHAYHWKDFEYAEAWDAWEARARQAKVDGEPEPPMPDCSGGLDYRFTRPPNPDCPRCEGNGRIYQRNVDTSKLSPAARLVYQGTKVTKNGRETIVVDKAKIIDMQVRLRGGFKDNIALGGTVGALIGNVDLTGKTPAEAARAYAEMMQATAKK